MKCSERPNACGEVSRCHAAEADRFACKKGTCTRTPSSFVYRLTSRSAARLKTRLDAPLPRVEADLESSEPSASLLTRHAARIATYLRESALPQRSFTGRMTGYHMGWLDRDGQPSRCSPGKFVRPALCLWAAEACGADIESALPVAAGIELIHNFTLIHDDIQDQDITR